MIQPIFLRKPNSALYYSGLFAFLLLSLLSYALSGVAAEERSSDIGFYSTGLLTIAQYSLLGLCMLLVWRSSPIHGDPEASHENPASKNALRNLLVVAVLARVLLFFVEPFTSNDVDRYLFDGKLVVEGFDPYRISHDAAQISDLRLQWQPPEEHAKYATLYPPLALGLFSVAAATGLELALTTWKLLILLASLSSLWLMTRVLRHANQLQHLPLMALSPLLLLESHVGLHVDAFSTFAVIAAIYCWQRSNLLFCGFIIGLGTAIKLLPFALLLPLVFSVKSILGAIRLVLAALFSVVAIYLVAILWGLYPVGSIGIFFEKWRFAAPLFTFLDQFLSGSEIVTLILILLLSVCGGVTYFLYSYRRFLPGNTILFFGAMQFVIALPLLVSPVVFPWYLMPLVPLCALYPNRYLIAWTVLMPLSYEVIGEFIGAGVWLPAVWPIWVIGAVQCLAALALLRYCYLHWPRATTFSRFSNEL